MSYLHESGKRQNLNNINAIRDKKLFSILSACQLVLKYKFIKHLTAVEQALHNYNAKGIVKREGNRISTAGWAVRAVQPSQLRWITNQFHRRLLVGTLILCLRQYRDTMDADAHVGSFKISLKIHCNGSFLLKIFIFESGLCSFVPESILLWNEWRDEET